MSFYSFKHVAIKGLSVVVPANEINIYDEAEYYGNSVKKIDRMRKMVGFYKRRVAEDDVTAADLGVQAAENLLAGMKIDRQSIDALLFMVQQPDYAGPCTSYSMHHRLGLSHNCAATDVVQGCVGWVYGLWLASQMIESGAHKRVLLIAADTAAKGVDLKNRLVAPVFGDGGTATLIEYDENAKEIIFNQEVVSEGYEAIITPAGGRKIRYDFSKSSNDDYNEPLLEKIETASGYSLKLIDGYMDGLAVFDFTKNYVPKNIKELMSHTQTTPEDFSYLCLHQANKQIIQTVGELSGFSLDKVPYDAFENYGNNTMCSIPTTIASIYPPLQPKGSYKLLCCAFGNGLVCLSCVLDLEGLWCSKIKDYAKPANHKNREELIEYWTNKIKNT